MIDHSQISSGDFCEIEPQSCTDASCNGHYCTDNTDGTGYTCHCSPEFTGANCDVATSCGCQTSTLEITDYTSSYFEAGDFSGDAGGNSVNDFANWQQIPGGIAEDQGAFIDGRASFNFRWSNVPAYLQDTGCTTLKAAARQNDCGGGCGFGLQNFTISWTSSCEASVYVWSSAYFLNAEDFTGGLRDHIADGWTQIQDGTETNDDRFLMRFSSQSPTQIVNKSPVLKPGQNTVTWQIEDLWVGGVAICREQNRNGPCGIDSGCTNLSGNSFTCEHSDNS